MTIKEVFDKAENGTLTFEQFTELTKEAKFVDLKTGEYVSMGKFDDELKAKDGQIATLNKTIADRNKDLEEIQTKLAEAGDNSSKLQSLTDDLTKLQAQYDTDAKNWKAQLQAQAYEFAVKEFANTKEFTSAAAKRDFVRQLQDAKLKLDGDKIMGAEDFATKYEAENEGAFRVATPDPTPAPKKEDVPTFTGPTGGGPAPKKYTLSEMMAMQNANPEVKIDF